MVRTVTYTAALGSMLFLCACSLSQSSEGEDYMRMGASEILDSHSLAGLVQKADEGSASAMRRIAIHYEVGVMDGEASFGWWRRCAQTGLADCQFRMYRLLQRSALCKERELGEYFLSLARGQNRDYVPVVLDDLAECH